jgi:replicative DNA helicase
VNEAEQLPEVDRPEPIPRRDLEAEQAVLGGILLAPHTVAAVSAILSPADFYHPAHEVIFEAILALDRRHEPIDVLTVSNELISIRRINTVGGRQYLGELTDSVPTVAHIEQHAQIVADNAALRRLRRGCVSTIGKIDDHGNTREAVFDHGAREYLRATEMRSIAEPVSILDAMEESLEKIIATLDRGSRVTGRSTGFHDLDANLAGLHPGQLIILAARPAMGKSALALNFAHAVAAGTRERPGAPVLFVSIEMKRVELANRLLCAVTRVDAERVRTNSLTQEDMNAWTSGMQQLGQLPLWIVDSDSATLEGLKATARRFRAKRGQRRAPAEEPEIGLIVVDYLQLMRGSEQSREQQISNISRGLKELAGEMNCPIVALSQLNRDLEKRPGKDRRPQLSDLRESGAIEQDADVVLFVYRDEVYHRDTDDRGIAEVITAKQRNGPTATTRLRWVGAITKFENMSERDSASDAGSGPSTSSGPYDPYANAFADDPGPSEPNEAPRAEAWTPGSF